jgi:hypothetical protein
VHDNKTILRKLVEMVNNIDVSHEKRWKWDENRNDFEFIPDQSIPFPIYSKEMAFFEAQEL